MAVNKFDNSMLDANTIGTSANQLLQLDSNTKYPAVDGSLLTGIPSPFTASASDPTISTNPSGGVGTLWKNTSSGEMYCCTDATAGANVWTNVGAGTGDISPFFGTGDNYGYHFGGWPGSPAGNNHIEKYSFTASANATDVGDLAQGVYGNAGHSSSTHGYATGGQTVNSAGPRYNNIQKFSFSSDGNATDSADLALAIFDAGGTSSETHGYSAGGNKGGSPYQTKDIQKFPFASATNASDIGDMLYVTAALFGTTSSTHCYWGGGHDGYPPGNAYNNQIEKLPHATDGNSTDVGNLTENRRCWGGAQSSSYGYRTGGGDSPYSNVIDKWSYSSDGNATDVGDLLASLFMPSNGSSTNYGYTVAGYLQGGPASNTIQKWAFASDGNATDVADLIAINYNGAGAQY